MFTGLVEELGTVRAVVPNATGARLEIEATTVLDDVTLGASIAVNGCCLTAVEFGEGWWAADAVEETLHRTCLGALGAGTGSTSSGPSASPTASAATSCRAMWTGWGRSPTGRRWPTARPV